VSRYVCPECHTEHRAGARGGWVMLGLWLAVLALLAALVLR
jgi:hypothetical protein